MDLAGHRLKSELLLERRGSTWLGIRWGLKAPRGYGWIAKPRKAAYNRIYSRTSRGCLVCLAIVILFAVLIAAQIASASGHGSGSKSVYVHGYTRKDSTYVSPHYRSAPGTASYSSTVDLAWAYAVTP
jgi:hypothetical protein